MKKQNNAPILLRLARLSVLDENGCLVWNGTKTGGGYGHLNIGGGKNKKTHRLAYEQAVGPIPDGLVLDHLCRNRACWNWNHLEPVTHRVNILRGVGASAHNANKDHCPEGHEYSPENTYLTPRGYRKCRACRLRDSRMKTAELARMTAERDAARADADRYISLIHQAMRHHHDFHGDCDHFRIADDQEKT